VLQFAFWHVNLTAAVAEQDKYRTSPSRPSFYRTAWNADAV